MLNQNRKIIKEINDNKNMIVRYLYMVCIFATLRIRFLDDDDDWGLIQKSRTVRIIKYAITFIEINRTPNVTGPFHMNFERYMAVQSGLNDIL